MPFQAAILRRPYIELGYWLLWTNFPLHPFPYSQDFLCLTTSHEIIHHSGEAILKLVCNVQQDEDNLDIMRYKWFCRKVAMSCSVVELGSLPSTQLPSCCSSSQRECLPSSITEWQQVWAFRLGLEFSKRRKDVCPENHVKTPCSSTTPWG